MVYPWIHDPSKFSEEEVASVKVLLRMMREGRLFATIDEEGEPFHEVTTITQNTRFPDRLVLWLFPQGVDDDLRTPMGD
jgi:hypothetical protein